MSKLEVGGKAPAFTLLDESGAKVRLSDLAGRWVVLYFYPKDDTSGCTLEARDFSAARKDFDKAGAAIIGISPDSEASHCKFKEKYDLGVTLAADPDHEAIEAYGVWRQKSMYGRKYMGVERSTFLVGLDRRIVRVWRNVKVPGHVEDVLAAVRSLRVAAT